MKTLECYVLCGVPGVGKSTAVKEKLSEFAKNGYRIIDWSELRSLPYEGNTDCVCVVDFDEIKAKYVKIFKSSEDFVYHKILNEFVYCLHFCKEKGLNVIIDTTNVRREQRLKKLEMFDGYKTICLCFIEDFDEVLKRNAARDRVVPQSVIEEYFRDFEVPELNEPFDEIYINGFPIKTT